MKGNMKNETLAELKLKQLDRDKYFMRHAKLFAEQSKCLSRKIGAVLVKDYHVISMGCNGPPFNIPPCNYRDDNGNYTNKKVSDRCPRQRMGFNSGEGMEHCVAVHGELYPILQTAKLGGVSTEDTTLYAFCWTPCINCTKEIINAGIKRVVCLGRNGPIVTQGVKSDYNFPLAEKLFELSGVKLDVIREEDI